MNISLKIEGQSIEVDSVLQLASDTISQVDCSVQLSAEWSDFDLVKCVWENQHIAEKYVSTITNGTTEVPQEVLTERGSVRVNLVGYDVTGTAITERLTTYKIQVVVVKQKVNITGTISASPTAAEWPHQLTAHTGNTTVHVTAQNKTDWNAKLSDAPSDSKTYGRKNGAWTEVTGYATEAWVGQQGFGTYTKPSSGIPSSDLTSAVQTSLTKADTALQSVPATYRTSAEQDVIDNGKADKRTVATTIGAVASVNTDYFLGTQESVSVTLPSSPSTGDLISVVFYSGATATSLSVSGTVIGDVPTPTTNQRVELNMLYDGTYWAVLSNTMAVS